MVWRGKAYKIPADKAFQIGMEVEDIATLAEIGSWGNNPRMFKLAAAYGTMLRFAGAKVADTQVLESITPGGDDEGGAASAVKALVDLLLSGAKTTGNEAPPEKISAS